MKKSSQSVTRIKYQLTKKQVQKAIANYISDNRTDNETMGFATAEDGEITVVLDQIHNFDGVIWTEDHVGETKENL